MDGKRYPYQAARKPVKDAMRHLYYDWMEIKPSNCPPNMYPRVMTINGRVGRRDYLPVKSITRDHYTKYRACNAKYLEVIWEFTPNGRRATVPIILETKRVGSETYWSFGSCHACWKLDIRNFTNTDRTPHPLSASVNDPNLPRMGQCGCICCNKCVQELETHAANEKECYVHCLYCGNKACFSKNLLIWVISHEVKQRMEMTQTKEVVDSVMGQDGEYQLNHYEDGLIFELGKKRE